VFNSASVHRSTHTEQLLADLSTAPIEALHHSIEGAGLWGPVGLLAAFVIGALVLAPRWFLCFVAGLSFGQAGLALALPGATLGAALAFWIGRRVARPIVARFVDRRPKLRAIALAVQQEGWKAVLLFRLGPVIPSSLQSYLFGAADVSFWPYLGATLAGILPGVTVQVAAGALGRAMWENALAPWQTAMLGIGLAASAISILLITRRARRILSEDQRGGSPCQCGLEQD
jgi:uncharacterized membrane protein YdjX (TVP38/TMEM64 family)